jgi:DNA-binding LacI/PurR family transcriptional regulator
MFVSFPSPGIGHEDDPLYGVGGRRVGGVEAALAEYGIRAEERRVIQAATTIKGGAAALAQALSCGPAPTAVFALSDVMALGVITEASRRGIRVPDDLEVIGFDDIPLAALVRPALSTVHQPVTEKGQLAATMLIRALEGSAHAERVLLPTHLVLRESTRQSA